MHKKRDTRNAIDHNCVSFEVEVEMRPTSTTFNLKVPSGTAAAATTRSIQTHK